jgi:3'-5' exoribonuclease
MDTERTWVNELQTGQPVDQIFVVRDKDLRTTKKGEYYISATLGDRTGGIPARMWQATESIFQGIPPEGFLRVKGRVEDYRGQPQIVFDACRPVPPDQVQTADFLPASEYDVEEMWSELTAFLRKIRNRPLKLLVKKFTEDRKLVAAVKKSPAAAQMHHAFQGGLIEHTLNIARSAEALLPLYPQLDADLVRAGIFLHDLGKSAELSGGLAIHYTDRGMLVGHLAIACIWVQEKARALEAELGQPFPHKTITLLQHLILSHHGQHDFGSPKLPAIPEAFFIHYLDNLDAKMWMLAHAIDEDHDEASDFTPYIRQLETRLYKRTRPLADLDDETQTGSLFGQSD